MFRGDNLKVKYALIVQLLLVVLFFILTNVIEASAVFILALHHSIAFITIHYSLRFHDNFKINWLLVSSLPLLMTVGLLVPVSFHYMYLASSFLMLITILSYFLKNIKNWHRIQLILDVIVMLIIVLGMASALVFSKMDSTDLSGIQWVDLITIMVTNLIALLIVFVMISSTSLRKLPGGLSLAILGLLSYITHNFLVLYNTYYPTQIPDTYTHLLRLAAFSLFAIGTLIRNPYIPLKREFSKNNSPDNLNKTKLVLWLSLIPLALYFLDVVNLTHFAIIAIAVIIYQLLSFYVQKTAIMEILLEQDKYLQDKLEALVDDRTMELKKANNALYDLTTMDDLTGLFNRSYFIHLLDEQIHIEGNHFSVFFMDLDRFKIINDLHGHDMGDKVLQIIAERFKDEIKNCEIARVGGDEFALLYHNDKSVALEEMSRHILKTLAEPIIIDDYQFHVGISIGIARFPKEALSVKQLMKYADIAMYHAKHEEHNDNYVLYSSHLIEKIERRNYIELLLREANYEKDFELYYQPKFETVSRELIGMEALIRWHHEEEGFISPAEFIPIAEETGLILKLSDWIFATAMSRIKVINTENNSDLIMSINVSPLSLDSISFLPNLRTMIKKIQVDPAWIELEITEHSAMNTATRMEELFTSISGLGVHISIDDFGTGYSSLNYIKRFDIDILKIAKELIDNIEHDMNDRLIVNAIVKMAKGMGLRTIAEGVESHAQLHILEDLECDAIQGYILGRPVPAEVFEHHYL